MAKQLRKPKLQEVVSECAKARCTRREGQYCLGWIEPAYMWRKGKCPHVSHEPGLKERLEAEGMAYANGTKWKFSFR